MSKIEAKFEVGEIHFFNPYLFTDQKGKNVLKSRNTIVCLSKESFENVSMSTFGSRFSNQALFAIIATKTREKHACLLKKEKYTFLDHDSYACPTRIDIQSTSEAKKYQGILSKDDAKQFYKHLRNSLFSPFTQNVICKKPFIRATIMQEWKFFLS